MLAENLRDKAPALLLLAATAILAAAFALPVGSERRMGTSYRPLAGWAASFTDPARPEGAASAQLENARPAAESGAGSVPHERGGDAALMAQAPSPVRGGTSPAAASDRLKPASPKRAGTAGIRAAMARASEPGRPARASARKTAAKEQPADVIVASSAAAAVAPPSQLNAAAPALETGDSVADEYEGNPAKYPLDGESSRDAVTLRLSGVCRSGQRVVLKVAVSNRGKDDFFVKEIVIRDGPEVLESRFFMRLFVEPGRTREGYVVFSKPRTGASIHAALKEDRENGRSFEVAVRYPF